MVKVRIKKSGEVVELAENSLIAVHRQGEPEFQDEEYPIDEVVIIPDGSDGVRIEFAKSAMQSLLLRGNKSNDRLAKRAFEIADAMMKHLA